MSEQVLRLFVSSPGDVAGERRRIDLVVERLNAEFSGRVRIETVRWELSYYSAHETFQRQIPAAAECDVVVAVFRGRLGTPLPAAFPPLPSGEPYPSGTAYEILSAMEVRRAGKRVPDVYVFRYPDAPQVGLDAPDRAEIEQQWGRLKSFFDTWFRNQAGEFLAAFQTYVSTDDFAVKVEECLRQWLSQRGFTAQGSVWDRVLLGSPFPGLEAFDSNRGRVFFGRELALGQAVERLREAESGVGRVPFLLLIGASGSGKSSLLRAGLLPRLVLPGTVPEVDAWRVAVMTPGPDPFMALADALFADGALGPELRSGTFRTREMLARQMQGDPLIALAPLRDALERVAAARQREAGFDAPRPARLALGIDQAERLFTEAASGAAEALAVLLAGLVRERLATVAMALRSDAYALFQGSEALVALREAGATLDLVPPSPGELEEIVTRPVAACSPTLAFEQAGGRSLAALLVSDAQGGDALPLLQVSLARLYSAEAGRGDGVLRFSDYSGMDEAVTQTANEALGTLDGAARAELPALVAGLVQDVSTDPRTGIAAPVVTALDRGVFEAGSPARAALVSAFVGKRLLTAEGSGGKQVVRPVHEALLRIWPEAVSIVAETASLIRVRHMLAPLVRAWVDAAEGEKAGHLEVSPALLDGAQGLLGRFGGDLVPEMRGFIEAAAAADAARRDRERQEQERRIRDAEALAAAQRRAKQRTLVGLAAAVVLAVAAGWQWREAGAQRDRAQRTLALATQTANGLVFDLAGKFENTVGVPVAMVKEILDRARALQDQLLASGENTPALRVSQAGALMKTSNTLQTLGDTSAALATVQQACGILEALHAEVPGNAPYEALLGSCRDETGNVQLARGDIGAALGSYQSGRAIYERLAAANPSIASYRNNLIVGARNVGLMQQRQGDLEPALASFQAAIRLAEAWVAAEPLNDGAVRQLGVVLDDLGDLRFAQGDLDAALETFGRARALRQQITAAHPADGQLQHDLLVTSERIGSVLKQRGDLAGALTSYRAMLSIAERLAGLDPGNTFYRDTLAIAYADVGSIELAQGQVTAALTSYRAALGIGERLVAADPGNVGWQHDLWIVLEKIGDQQQAAGELEASAASFERSRVIAEKMAGPGRGSPERQRDLAALYNRIGDTQKARGLLDAAAASYGAGLAVIRPLAEANPNNPGWQRDLAISHAKIGDTALAAGDLAGASTHLREGCAVQARIAAGVPGNLMWQRELSACEVKIGDVLVRQKDVAGALGHYRTALAIRSALAAAEGNGGQVARDQAARDLVSIYLTITDFQTDEGKLGDARTTLETAVGAMGRFVAGHPGDVVPARLLSVLHNRLGDVHKAEKNPDAALARYRDAIAIMERLSASDPSNTVWQSDLVFSQERAGAVRFEQHDLPGSLESYLAARAVRERLVASAAESLQGQRELASIDSLVGSLQMATGDGAGGLASFKAAVPLRARLAGAKPDDAGLQRDMAQAMDRVAETQVRLGDPGGALASYLEALTVRQRIAALEPGEVSQQGLGLAYGKIGDMQSALHDPVAALASMKAAREVFAGLVAAGPGRAPWEREIAVLDNRVGDLAWAQGDVAAAAAEYLAAFLIVDRLAAAEPGNTLFQRDVAATASRVATVQERQGARDEALATLRRGREVLARLVQGAPNDKPLADFLAYFEQQIAGLDKRE